MNFIEIVLDLINKNGITKNKMLTDLNLSKNSINDWKNRGTIPNGETLSKIASYFNVTTDYLLGTETKKEPVSKKDKLIEDINKILETKNQEELNLILALARNLQSEQKK